MNDAYRSAPQTDLCLMRRTLAVVFVALFLAAMPAKGQPQGEYDQVRRRNLSGLDGIHVLVEDLPEWSNEFELNRSIIKSQVELALRGANIEVLSHEQHMDRTNTAVLFVSLSLITDDDGDLLIYSLDLEVERNVVVHRGDEFHRTTATVWGKGVFGFSGANNAPTFNEIAEDVIDLFVNDYLAAQEPQQQ